MIDRVLRRIARDMDGSACLWVVAWEGAGHHFRVWRLSPFDVRAIETWGRITAMRRSNGLPELPMPTCRTRIPRSFQRWNPSTRSNF